jgi:maltooligosyltrehalose trehalohydrolase
MWEGPALHDGERYMISIDGGAPMPDARSRFQPQGVHGASQWIELGAPPHTELRQVPLYEAVIYELHVGTFSAEGTFDGAIAHLDHLVELGVTHVEIMPVAQFSGRHGWGYDGVGLYAPHAPYGGPAGLRRLVDACHARRLAVVVDVVHNHFGPEGAYWNQLAPYTTSKHKTPWGEAINLDDTGSAEVRRYLIESALMWLRDYGADGLRLDALHALVDTSERHFVAELVDAVRALERQLDRKLLLIGEFDEHEPAAVTPRERGGWGLDAHWNDDFHHAVHVLLTGERTGYYGDFSGTGTLAKILEHGYALDGGYSAFRNKPHGSPYGDLPRSRLVSYIQSHDQIGNRAAGDRLHQLAGIERAMIGAAILFVSPFVPMLFQGEEWAASSPFQYFAELESEELREAVRKGRMAEHSGAGWDRPAPDPTDPSTRERSVLRWHERSDGTHAAMLTWYRALIEARRMHPALRDDRPGTVRVHRAGPLLTIERGTHTLACNLGDEPSRADGGEVVLASHGLASTHELPPRSCVLYRTRT